MDFDRAFEIGLYIFGTLAAVIFVYYAFQGVLNG
jgi:hypothetical protein